MPASGKTSLGLELSSRLEIPFYDTDAMLTDKHGMSITDMFQSWGEPEFRKRESEMLKLVMGKDAGLVSLGGGAVLMKSNRSYIKKNNLVIYILLSLEGLIKNIQDPADRPLIDFSHDKEAKVKDLLNEREDIYKECADIVINMDGLSITAGADKILAQIPS